VGATAFKELCRQWVGERSGAAGLPFEVQEVGSHWSRHVQVDVVGVNWTERAILLGECKWGGDPVGRSVVRELIEDKTPRVLRTLPDEGQGWTVHHAVFSRAGLTDAAQREAAAHGALWVDLHEIDGRLSGTRP